MSKKIYIINIKDCKFIGNEFIGLKRKYGKHKRNVYEFEKISQHPKKVEQ